MDIKWVKLKSIKDLLDKPHVYKIINLSNKIKSFGKDTSKKPARIVTHLREISRFARNDEFEIYVLYFDTKVQAENMERILHLELLDEIQCTDDVNSEEVLQDKELTKDLKKIRKETTIYDYSNHNMFPFSVGDTLKYIPDKKIEVQIESLGKNEIKVIYQNETFSLSALDKKLQNMPYSRQGTQYFEFKGKAITEYQ